MQDLKQVWTVKRLLDWSSGYFKSRKITRPKLSSELLLSSVLKCKRMQLYLNFDYALNKNELQLFKEYVIKRLKNIPIQYILKKAYFRNLELYVDENVLIPRPETELLVDNLFLAVLNDPGIYEKNRKLNILEAGTGSGAIAISIASEMDDFAAKNKCSFEWSMAATEISSKALGIAVENSQRLLEEKKLLHIDFIESDVLPEKSSDFNLKYNKKINIIISNPPYIKEKDFDMLPEEIRLFEPRGALVAGITGLEVYERILTKAIPFVNPKLCIIIFETDPDISASLQELVSSVVSRHSIKLHDIKTVRDYNSRERIIIARIGN